MGLVSYLRDKGLRRALQVAWRYKLPKLQVSVVASLTRRRPLEDKIVIESHNDFDCNGGAFYDYLVENGYNERVKIVWRLNRPCDRELPANVTWVPLYGPSWRKAWHICTAKWLTADCVVADKVRDDQVSVYMTHGVFGLKETHGLINVPPSVDYFLGLSPHMDSHLIWEFDINKDTTKVVHIGHPELDRLHSSRYSKEYARDRADDKRTILWMPTFRQGVAFRRVDSDTYLPYGIPLVKTEDDLETLTNALMESDVQLVIKLHPKQRLEGISSNVPDTIEFITGESIIRSPYDNFDLMLDADAMISDYSAAIYQYLVLGRPIAFVFSDVDEYKLGVVADADRYMPGVKIMNMDDLLSFIQDMSEGVDLLANERNEFRKWFYEPSDAGSCSRLVKLLGIRTADNH